MGQIHNLHPKLFDTAKYQVTKPSTATPATPAVDPDDAFFAKMNAAEDRGTHLTMFAQAKTLAAAHSTERSPTRDPREFRAMKVQGSKREQPIGSGRPAGPGENTTYQSIEKYGVVTPVKVSQSDSWDTGQPGYSLHHGHHRVYSANEINPEMEIPLVHADRERGRELVQNPQASEISMGGDYVKGGWTDPTVKPRTR